jgi:MarR family transcriptional regulator, negative regulator of the multidrug operon emrRAB
MRVALPELPMPEAVMVRLIRITVAGMTEYFEPVFRKMGLTENAFHVLCLLMASEQGRASPSELSDLVGTSRANMTRILEFLERDGLASRTVELRDARRHVIEITEKGRNASVLAVPQMAAPLKCAFAGLSPKEFANLTELLQKVATSFDTTRTPMRAAI